MDIDKRKESVDTIKNPSHYELEGLEPYQSIDVINSILKSVKDPVRAFSVGNALKYLIRAEKKNGLEDYKKAKVYLDWIIKEMEVTVDENKRRVKRDQGAKL